MTCVRRNPCLILLAVLALPAWAADAAADSGKPVYRCPGTPVLYTDSISAKEAKDKGCKTLEGTPITVVPGFRPRNAPSSGGANRGSEARVDPGDQRARDSDARKILEDELRKEEGLLASLKQEFNNGQPERRGDEKNYQKYLDRVAELKAGIARKESDVAALKRELGKL